uniref:WD40 domain protein beta Propeller n=1 Tax=Solibacter usitatus (strain Ellin6076) TaxID=234267 RepID=Q026U7_SOLUE
MIRYWLTNVCSFVLLVAVCPLVSGQSPTKTGAGRPDVSPGGRPFHPREACKATAKRAPDGLVVWSPDGKQYVVNKKDAAGVYQLYVGNAADTNPVCISCSQRPNSPAPDRHKLQPNWHPSGKWIAVAGEWDVLPPLLFSTPDLIEGWVQSGLWVNIYVTRPDGSEWHRLSDFGHGNGDGFTGVAFTPDGTQGVWAQIVDGNISKFLFGRWQLIQADFRQDANGVPGFSNLRDITPAGASWVEPGNFAPDGKSLVMTADIGLTDPQGMDQFILDISTGNVRNLTNSPDVWDEHGTFSPDGKKIFFMSSYPFRNNPLAHTVLFLQTEFMLMDSDGSNLQQVTHFNSPGYPESNVPLQRTAAAGGVWRPDGRQISALNLFFPVYQTWWINLSGPCGEASPRPRLPLSIWR